VFSGPISPAEPIGAGALGTDAAPGNKNAKFVLHSCFPRTGRVTAVAFRSRPGAREPMRPDGQTVPCFPLPAPLRRCRALGPALMRVGEQPGRGQVLRRAGSRLRGRRESMGRRCRCGTSARAARSTAAGRVGAPRARRHARLPSADVAKARVRSLMQPVQDGINGGRPPGPPACHPLGPAGRPRGWHGSAITLPAMPPGRAGGPAVAVGSRSWGSSPRGNTALAGAPQRAGVGGRRAPERARRRRVLLLSGLGLLRRRVLASGDGELAGRGRRAHLLG
jgi:hypothetical protein